MQKSISFDWCYSRISQVCKSAVIGQLFKFNFLFFQKKVMVSHWFRFRTNNSTKIQILKQSYQAHILDHHIDTKFAGLLLLATSRPVCNFWLGIARKLFLPPFFIVFSVKKEQTLEQKVFTADFHTKQTRSRIFLCHKIGFKLTGKPIPIYFESTQIILTKPKK